MKETKLVEGCKVRFKNGFPQIGKIKRPANLIGVVSDIWDDGEVVSDFPFLPSEPKPCTFGVRSTIDDLVRVD